MASSALPFLLLLAVGPAVVLGQNVILMLTYTSDRMMADTSFVELEMVNNNFDSCVISHLQYFENYTVDAFQVMVICNLDPEIESCFHRRVGIDMGRAVE